LDSSASNSYYDFQKELQSVAEFAKFYVIGPHDVQIGIVTFSSTARNEFYLNSFTNIKDIEQAINKITPMMTSTHTGRALQYVRLNSFNASKGDRGNIPNFLVVITDGRSKGVYNVTTESINLHNSNIEIFAVGIGSDISITELKAIASSASHVFTVKDFHHLHLALHNIRCGEYKD
jgi:collagen type VI alpha